MRYNPETSILNMRERAAVRNAHTFEFFTDGAGIPRGVCLCGHQIESRPGWVSGLHALAMDHVDECMKFARGRKCAEARARADQLDREIDAALWAGLTAQQRATFRLEADVLGVTDRARGAVLDFDRRRRP